MDVRTVGRRLEHDDRLDVLVGPMREAVAALPSEPRRVLRGEGWLGHPAHPMLTDLPIGFWTSAFVLDLVPTRRTRSAATAMVGLGVLCALPTAAAGLADWASMSRGKQRVGVVHAAANAAATALYAASFASRLRTRRVRGFLLGMAGATAATAGGYLGGHLAYGTTTPASDEPEQSHTRDGVQVTPPADALDALAAGGPAHDGP